MLKIAPNLSLPMDFVTQTQAILAARRRGKTYTASVQAEELLRLKQQIVVIDITGAWWGLKSTADGKSAGYDIVIAGGEHADIPLSPDAGRVMAEAIATDHFSCILDLQLLRKGQRLHFLADFLEAFHAMNRDPVHVFADEADDYIPQQIMWKDVHASKCLGAMDDLVRRGGIHGIGTTLITQRPAVINNNVLTQCQILTLLRLFHPADIKPVREWVKLHATPKEEADVIAALPTLGLGQAIVWSPGWPEDKPIGIKHVQIRERITFNSSRTPKAGERVKAPKVLAKTDLDKLCQRIKEISEKAKADDPKLLRQQLAELQKQLLAKNPRENPRAANSPEGLEKARQAGFAEGVRQSALAIKQHQKSIESLKQRISKAAQILGGDVKFETEPKNNFALPPQVVAAKPVAARIPETRVKTCANYAGDHTGNGELGKGERAILCAVAQYDGGCSQTNIAILTGYKATSRRVYLGALKQKGYVSGTDPIVATKEGIDALGDSFEPLPTGDALRAHWLQRLGGGEQKILEALIAVWPAAISSQEIQEQTGYKATSVRVYLSALKARKVAVDLGRGSVAAAETIFS